MTYSWDRAQLSCPRVKSLAHGPNSDTLKTLGFELKIFWWVVHFIRCTGSWYIPHCTSLTVRGTVQLDNKKKQPASRTALDSKATFTLDQMYQTLRTYSSTTAKVYNYENILNSFLRLPSSVEIQRLWEAWCPLLEDVQPSKPWSPPKSSILAAEYSLELSSTSCISVGLVN